VVFTGDPEQIDHPYLDASSNGLTYLVEKFKGESIAGHVTLSKGERSALAELGSRIL
jgi:PhoH-like ATPase